MLRRSTVDSVHDSPAGISQPEIATWKAGMFLGDEEIERNLEI